MGRYIRKRLLQAVPVVFGITILTFFIMKMACKRNSLVQNLVERIHPLVQWILFAIC